MNTHVEHSVVVHPASQPLLSRLAARLSARFKAWRAQQIERAEIEALEALGPEMLDDIGVSIVKSGKPPKSIAVCNPYLIATKALSTAHPTERGEI